MPGMFLDYPFDEDIFLRQWGKEPDLLTTNLINSGVLVRSDLITQGLSNGGHKFSVPFYKPIDGEPAPYDGETDIPTKETAADFQSGVSWAYMQGWTDRDFIYDHSGADPMGHIVSQVAKFWANWEQNNFVKFLDALLGVTGMSSHKATVNYPEDNEAKAITELNKAIAKVFLNGRSAIGLLAMNTTTATLFENIGILEYRKGVEARPYAGTPREATILGMNALIDDTAVTKDNEIYALGVGSILAGDVPIRSSVELGRDPVKYGGVTGLYTKIGGVWHPNGLSYKGAETSKPATMEEIQTAANWELKFDHKSIPIAKFTMKAAAATVTP